MQNTTSLMYNAQNETLLNRFELAQLPLPAALGSRHNPYPFSDYIDEVTHALNLNGLQITNEEFAVDHDNLRMFGIMEVGAIEGQLITDEDWKLLVGVRGSHDCKISRGLTLGSQVLVCSNLCFHGNIGTFNTKQTLNIGTRLPGLIQDAVAHIPELAETQQLSFDNYKNQIMLPRQGDAMLIELHRRGGLSSSQLGHAVKEWDNPSHEEHAEHDYSVWRLLNACTEAVKPTGNNVNMNTIQRRTQITSTLMDELVGVH